MVVNTDESRQTTIEHIKTFLGADGTSAQVTHGATRRSEGGACLCRFDHPPASGSKTSVHCMERAGSIGTQLATLNPHLWPLADGDQGEHGVAQFAPIGSFDFGLGSARQAQAKAPVD